MTALELYEARHYRVQMYILLVFTSKDLLLVINYGTFASNTAVVHVIGHL